MTTWDILIPTIPHRHENLVSLLDTLAPQMRPGIKVIVYRDNLEARYGPKCDALVKESDADYISFLSDDDSVSPDFVKQIMAALEEKPDYVGFRVRFTRNGAPQRPVIHSLKFDGWEDRHDALVRDITHFNPIRRELALQGSFRGHEVTDRDWADDLRALGNVKSEVFIDAEIHYYQHMMGDCILTKHRPLEALPPLPEYPFVEYMEPAC